MSNGTNSSGGGGGGKSSFNISNKSLDELYKDKFHSFGVSGPPVFDWWKNEENGNAEDVIKNATDDEQKGITAWTGGSFMGGQQYKNYDDMDERRQFETTQLDNIMNKSVLNKNITVARLSTAELVFGSGNKFASPEDFAAQEGQLVFCKGSLATTAKPHGVKVSGGTVEYKIHIPAGKGHGVWIGDGRVNPTFGTKEREYVTRRDTWYKVGKSKYDAKRDVTVVDLFMVSHGKHDYGKTGKVNKDPWG